MEEGEEGEDSNFISSLVILIAVILLFMLLRAPIIDFIIPLIESIID